MATDAEANALGLSTPKPTDLISGGDDAITTNARRLTDLYHEIKPSRGVIPSGANLNDYWRAAHNGTWMLSASNTYVNAPFTGGGLVRVDSTGATAVQTATKYGVAGHHTRAIRNAYSTPVLWHPWELAGKASPTIIELTSGADLDALRTPGSYVVPNTTIAQSLTGTWPEGIPRVVARIDVTATSAGITWQNLRTYSADHHHCERNTASIGSSPFPFNAWKDLHAPAPAATSAASAGLANALLVDEFTQRRGGRIPTAGRAAVALRFDHGLANFSAKVLPLLRARDLPCSLALNSGSWSLAENTGVTAAMVNGWVTDGDVEIWNHGRYHWDADTEAKLTDYIVNGLAELRTQLPAAKIDGWVIPGVGGTGYMGLGGGTTPAAFSDTAAGRLILSHHAISTGAFPGSAHRVIDGRPRQGMGHYTIDARTPAQVTTEISTAQANVRGLQLMLHPSLVDTSGNISTASLTAVLDHIAAERDAGRLVVLTPYELMLADSHA